MLLAGLLRSRCLVPVLVASQQAPTFRSNTQTVPLYVTVVGADGRLVTDLTRDDFIVFDNGRPQPLTLFDSGIQPISIIVMLDMSGSMLGNLPMLRQRRRADVHAPAARRQGARRQLRRSDHHHADVHEQPGRR